MKFIKNYGIIAVLMLLIILSAIIRNSGTDRFRVDAFRHAIPSIKGENIIHPEKIAGIAGTKLLVKLDNGKHDFEGIEVLYTAPRDILSEENLLKIRKTDGTVLLFSDDLSVSARAWMLLAQKGLDNVYIIADGEDEYSKNEFRPDTLIKPELLEY